MTEDEIRQVVRNLADAVHPARIAVPAIDDQRVVDVEDIALAQRLVVGNAVADDMVDRGADRFGVAAVKQRRRIGAVVHGELVGEVVETLRGDAGSDMVAEHVEPGSRQPAGLVHGGESLRAMDLDYGIALARSPDTVVEGHMAAPLPG